MADGHNPQNPIPAVESNGAAAGDSSSAQTTQTTQPTQPSSTPDYSEYIPAEHRSNPRAYFDKIKEDQAWSDYGRRIAPHHKTFESVQQQWNEFETWRKSQTQPQRQPASQPQPAPFDDDRDDEIDYSDPEQVKRALRQVRQQVKGHVDHFTNEFGRLSAEQKQGQDTLFSFVKIQQELRDLQNEELYSHAKFQPTVKPEEIAQFMLDNNINDSRRAYELLYGKPSLEAKVQRLESQAQEMYQKGKADAEAEVANRRVTTETSAGTPWRRPIEARSAHPPNSMERKQEILEKISQKIGAPIE